MGNEFWLNVSRLPKVEVLLFARAPVKRGAFYLLELRPRRVSCSYSWEALAHFIFEVCSFECFCLLISAECRERRFERRNILRSYIYLKASPLYFRSGVFLGRVSFS